MLHIILYQPEIPPNTGNIIRLCANTGAELHLIHPLGFELNEKSLRRAGLDYHEWARVHEYESWETFKIQFPHLTVYACTTKATQLYTETHYPNLSALLFGPESRGLPKEILERFNPTQKIKIPMQAHSRSLNLSNAVSIILYEAWRQQGFKL